MHAFMEKNVINFVKFSARLNGKVKMKIAETLIQSFAFQYAPKF